ALVADGSHLDCVAGCHGVHHGADTGLDKIDKFDGLPGAVERLPARQRNTEKMRAKPLVIPMLQQTEQPVGGWFRGLAASWHRIIPLGSTRTVHESGAALRARSAFRSGACNLCSASPRSRDFAVSDALV